MPSQAQSEELDSARTKARLALYNEMIRACSSDVAIDAVDTLRIAEAIAWLEAPEQDH